MPRMLMERHTELTTPSCPRNLRMMRPEATSHRNICRSPPQDTSLHSRMVATFTSQSQLHIGWGAALGVG